MAEGKNIRFQPDIEEEVRRLSKKPNFTAQVMDVLTYGIIKMKELENDTARKSKSVRASKS